MVSKNRLFTSLTVFLLAALLSAPFLLGAVYAQEQPPTEAEATAEPDDEIFVPPEAPPADSDPAPESGDESPEATEEPSTEPELTPEPFDDIPVPPGVFTLESAPDQIFSATVTTRYVAKSGTDSGDCTSSTSPCLTIQYAVGQASAGDTIRIAAGTYLENLTLYQDQNFEGAGINQTIVNGNNTAGVFDNFSNAALSFSDMTITNGFVSSGSGGGIYTDGALTMQRVEVTGNTANVNGGGGIYATDDILLEDVSVTFNQTNAWGAGIFISLESLKTATLNRVTISHNTVNGISSSNFGGGLQLQGLGTINLTNVTISHNYAWMSAAISSSHGNVAIQNATIANNTTAKSGDAGIVNYGTMTLLNTIIANNQPQNCAGFTTVTSLGYNISSDSTCNLTAAGDLPSTNPNLGALADNGGTTHTHAIPQNSPAVDTGSNSGCPGVDQRNYLRPADGDNSGSGICDIGAFEYHFPTTLAITDHTPNPSATGQSVSVSVEVGSGYAPVSGTVQIRGADTNCDITLSGNSGSCSVVFNSAGTKTITARYLGDANNDPASTTESHTVRTYVTKTVTSVGAYDGWVLESARFSNKGGSKNNTATTLSVGDDAKNRQYRSILHFNTATLPDNAVITAVKLQVKRASYTGTNPFNTHGALYVDLRKGAFSGNNALQAADWQAPASKLAAGKIPKTSASGWHTLNLATANFNTINKTGVTQFRLRFNKQDNSDNGADTVNFYSGNAGTSNRPKLTVTYYVP